VTELADELPVEAISRFANPRVTKPVDLGPCQCPGKPHERDSAVVRGEIGDGEARSAAGHGGYRDGTGVFDGAASDDESIARFTLSWTLVEADLKPVPITTEVAALLDAGTRDALLGAIGEAVGARTGGTLPNGFAGPSRASRRAMASRTQTARKRS